MRQQEIRFCTSADGTRIAYAVHGDGPPLVICTCWLSNLQHDWASPVWRHFLEDLGRIATVIRFDERGHGLSDRSATDFTLEARLGDLEAVVAHAGLERFALMALAQGGPVAVTYAARNPERVTRMAFLGSSASAMPDASDEELEAQQVFDGMIRIGWARPESTFRRVFTSTMIPDANDEQMRWLDELQRVAVDAETLIASRTARRRDDTRGLLPGIDIPTMVFHARRDRMMPFEEAVELASLLPRCSLVPFDSGNHILLPDDPSRAVFVERITAFLAEDRGEVHDGPSVEAGDAAHAVFDERTRLSAREREVLECAARGADNEAIAAQLHLSVRTVERHLQNIYGKLGVSGRTARAAAVARLLNASRF